MNIECMLNFAQFLQMYLKCIAAKIIDFTMSSNEQKGEYIHSNFIACIGGHGQAEYYVGIYMYMQADYC